MHLLVGKTQPGLSGAFLPPHDAQEETQIFQEGLRGFPLIPRRKEGQRGWMSPSSPC